MGIINEIGGVLLAGASGGILGIIGSGVNRVMAFKERAQKHEHDMQLAKIDELADNRRAAIAERNDERLHKHELALHKLNREAAAAETESEILLTREAGGWKGLEASHASAAVEAENLNVSVWVENYRAITRPNLTYGLWITVLILFFFVEGDARREIIESAIFCATASSLWWFGDRAPERKRIAAGAS